MTEKHWNIIGEEIISYTGGNAIIISNGDCEFAIWERKEDVQKICNNLNELVDENKQLKAENQMLKYIMGRNESYIARLTHKGEWKDTTKP